MHTFVRGTGFVLINLNPDCAPFESSYRSILSRFDEWGLEGLVSAHQVTYNLTANWKVVFQNYSECYHCSLVHPQLNPALVRKYCSSGGRCRDFWPLRRPSEHDLGMNSRVHPKYKTKYRVGN